MYPRLARLRLRDAALHSAPLRAPFLPRPPDDARSALPILALACVLRGKRCARTPCPPLGRMTMRPRGGILGRDPDDVSFSLGFNLVTTLPSWEFSINQKGLTEVIRKPLIFLVGHR